MKFFTNVFNLVSDSLLVMLFASIVVISSLSVIALSPVSYESTLKKDENVLGINTKNNIESLINRELFEELYYTQNDIKIGSFKGDDGIIFKADAGESLVSQEFGLVGVNNPTSKVQNYNMYIDLKNGGFVEEFNIIINGIKIPIVFDDNGKFSSPLKIDPNNRMELGLDITNITGNFEIEIINNSSSQFVKLP